MSRYDIGPTIGIDGEAEFRKAIQNINTNIKTLSTEMLAVTSAYDANDKSAAALTSQNEVLNKQIDAQKEKLAKLQEGLAASAEKYGEGDEKTQRWQQTVNAATAELNKMERQLASNNQEMESQAHALDDVIEGEDNLRSAISSINTNIKTLGTEMLAVTSAYDANDKSAAALTSRNEVLTKQIDAQREKLAKLQEGLSAAAEKFGESDEKTQQWQQEVNAATAELNKMERQLALNNQELDDQGSALDKVKEKAAAFGSGLAAAAKVAVAGLTAAIVVMSGFAKSAVDTGMQFDSSMSQVAATMGTTVDQIGELRDFAMEMGATTAFSATEAADALNYMALAGYDAGTSMSMLPTVLDLAAAGGIDLASASDMVTDAQSALGLSIEEAADMVDKMAMASSKSNTSVAQLGEAILAIGGTAKNVSGGTTELSTALGILADNGIKGAEGGTHLRNIILSLSAPTDTAAKALAGLGVEVFDAEGNMRPLNEALGDLNGAMSSMTQAEQTNLISTIFNKTDIAAVNALLANTGERWDELTGYIDEATGAAGQMANTQLDNLAGDITLFKSALEGAQIVLSDQLTPNLREFVQFGSEGVSALSAAFQEDGLSGAMDALGAILSDGLSMVIEQLPAMTDAGMQLLGALGEGILGNSPMIASAAMEIIATLSSGLADSTPELIPVVVDVILQIVDTLTDPDNLSNLIDAALEIIVSLATGLIDALPKLAERVPQIIANIVTTLANNLPKITESALKIVTTLGAGLIKAIPQLVKSVPQLVAAIVNAFSSLASRFSDIGKNIVTGVWQGIQNMASWIKEKVSGFFGGIVDSVKGLLGIHSPSKVFAGIGGYMAEGLGVGFDDEMGAVQRRIDRSMRELSGNAVASVSVTGGVSGGQSDDVASCLANLPALIAQAVHQELEGMAVNLNMRKVGEMTSTWQGNYARAMGV